MSFASIGVADGGRFAAAGWRLGVVCVPPACARAWAAARAAAAVEAAVRKMRNAGGASLLAAASLNNGGRRKAAVVVSSSLALAVLLGGWDARRGALYLCDAGLRLVRPLCAPWDHSARSLPSSWMMIARRMLSKSCGGGQRRAPWGRVCVCVRTWESVRVCGRRESFSHPWGSPSSSCSSCSSSHSLTSPPHGLRNASSHPHPALGGPALRSLAGPWRPRAVIRFAPVSAPRVQGPAASGHEAAGGRGHGHAWERRPRHSSLRVLRRMSGTPPARRRGSSPRARARLRLCFVSCIRVCAWLALCAPLLCSLSASHVARG